MKGQFFEQCQRVFYPDWKALTRADGNFPSAKVFSRQKEKDSRRMEKDFPGIEKNSPRKEKDLSRRKYPLDPGR